MRRRKPSSINGSLSQEDWNLTVGALRDRAGVKNIWPEDTANYKPDQWLIDYYAQAEGAAITNLSNTDSRNPS